MQLFKKAGDELPTYVYECALCNVRFDVGKSVNYLDTPEICSTCGAQMKRVPCLVNFFSFNWSDGGEYNPGLGCRVKDGKHKKDLLKKYKDDNGSELIEVGNDDPRKYIEPVDKRHERELKETVEECQKKISN